MIPKPRKMSELEQKIIQQEKKIASEEGIDLSDNSPWVVAFILLLILISAVGIGIAFYHKAKLFLTNIKSYSNLLSKQ